MGGRWGRWCPCESWLCMGAGAQQRVGDSRNAASTQGIHPKSQPDGMACARDTASRTPPRARALTAVERELLPHAAGCDVPHDGALVRAAGQQHVAALVPAQRKHRPRVPLQRRLELACGGGAQERGSAGVRARVQAHRGGVWALSCASEFKGRAPALAGRGCSARKSSLPAPGRRCRGAAALTPLAPRAPQVLTLLGPHARLAIIRAGGQQAAVRVPLERGDVLALGRVVTRRVVQHARGAAAGARRQVPYPRRRVAAPGGASSRGSRLSAFAGL